MIAGLPGLDPSWSRRIDVVDGDGVPRTWHLLERPADWGGALESERPAERAFSDTGRISQPPGPAEGAFSDTGRASRAPETQPVATMLCLHGNPTWSYLWRRFLAAAPPGWRVIAPDQLGMGWSERLDRPRRLAERIDDLDRLTDALGVTGPVVAVAHDWGGPVLLGWAERHRDLLAGIVLTNTGVAVPADTAPPGLISLARSRPLLDSVCVRTPAFVRGATAVSRPAPPKEIRDAYASPYAIAVRRQAVRDFVADIPLESDHPSRAALDGVVDGLTTLADVPTLLVWGPRDPVFSIRYLHDLRRRLPHADVQLYPQASHLVVEDAPQAAADVWTWVNALATTPQPTTPTEPTEPTEPPRTSEPKPIWAGLLERADDPATAIAELGSDAQGPISFADLYARVEAVARGLVRAGVRPGDRVAMLVRPGIDLTVAVYATWLAGAAIVVADAGLGLRNLGRALRSADPDHLIAIPSALTAARALRVPGHRIVVGDLSATLRRALRVRHSLAELELVGRGRGPGQRPAPELPPIADDDAEAAVLFTSGATGPAKGVVYRHRQLRAQLDLVRQVCRLRPGARLVAAFAPFALYGPALGAAAAVPDMDVTQPATLTATALADAVAAVQATVVFASPAALRNIAATASELTADQRSRLAGVELLLSAGAPVPLSLLDQVQSVLPGAELHTPYGMTEALPVTDVTAAEIRQAPTSAGLTANGVCVGRALPGVEIAIDPLTDGHPTGEIRVRAAHVKDHYDRLWVTQRRSADPPGWHRTGDVGRLDEQDRLWVEGRLVHVITGPDGSVTPVGLEQRVETLPGVSLAAAVGVGPAGTQQTVVVVVPADASSSGPLAPPSLAGAVREVARTPVAAVLVTDRLPVDIRHASKIDRVRVASWAERILAGRPAYGRDRRP